MLLLAIPTLFFAITFSLGYDLPQLREMQLVAEARHTPSAERSTTSAAGSAASKRRVPNVRLARPLLNAECRTCGWLGRF